mgnify:FL=1
MVNVKDGSRQIVKKDLSGVIAPSYISPTGKYIMWYDYKAKNYFAWDGDSTRNITSKIKVPLYNEEHDSPSDPAPYGVMGWLEGDSIVFIYDRYDYWEIDPTGKHNPNRLTSYTGRTKRHSFRYIKTDPEETFIKKGQFLLFRIFDEVSKKYSLTFKSKLKNNLFEQNFVFEEAAYGQILKAKGAAVDFIYTK